MIQLLLITFVLLFMQCGNQQSSGETDVTFPVSVRDIAPGSIKEMIPITGTVYATGEVTLNSEISGDYKLRINPRTKKTFAMGDVVKKGESIIHIYDEEYENNVKLESQRLSLEIAEKELEKQRSIYEKGGITIRELQNAELNVSNAKYSYLNARAKMDKVYISSPFEGVIVELPYFTQNTKVSTNSLLVRIMDYRKLYMETRLAAKEMGRVLPGQVVLATSYSSAKDTLRGNIKQTSPAIDPASRTFLTMLELENPQWLLRPGMFVKADIVIQNKDSTIVIPKEMVLSGSRGKSVFIVDRGRAEQRFIETGLENILEIEVVKGLKFGDRLIVKGFETLQNRSRVKVLQ